MIVIGGGVIGLRWALSELGWNKVTTVEYQNAVEDMDEECAKSFQKIT
jgi:pyruvate/2-oxoglutarate dehydrogenase complex dihydrolipoamide dehydrogenase (E3) component